jgi:hypothetical protein
MSYRELCIVTEALSTLPSQMQHTDKCQSSALATTTNFIYRCIPSAVDIQWSNNRIKECSLVASLHIYSRLLYAFRLKHNFARFSHYKLTDQFNGARLLGAVGNYRESVSSQPGSQKSITEPNQQPVQYSRHFHNIFIYDPQ